MLQNESAYKNICVILANFLWGVKFPVLWDLKRFETLHEAAGYQLKAIQPSVTQPKQHDCQPRWLIAGRLQAAHDTDGIFRGDIS